MKKLYKLTKTPAMGLILVIGLFASLEAFPQATGTLGIQAVGPTSVVIKIDTTGADAYRVESSMDNVSYTEITAFADTTVPDVIYHLLTGLTENTKYYLKLVPIKGGVDGTEVIDSVTTMEARMLIHMKFESENNGWTADDVTGKSDSLINATIAATGNAKLGNAASFQWTEVVPGIGPYVYSSIFLDSAFMQYANDVSAPPELYSTNYTETTYSLWFKNNDTTQIATKGSVLASFGSSVSNGVFWRKDELILATASRWSPGIGNVFHNDTVPFPNNTDWNHLAYVFKEGMVYLYLNGELVISLDQHPQYFWQSYNTRPNDHWASNQLAAVYWFNRALNPVTPENLGDVGVWHHQFNGLMDEFKVFSYALTESEIKDMVAELAPGAATTSAMGIGPNSIALTSAATDATSFKFEVKTGAGAFEEKAPVLQSELVKKYFLLDGLTENTEYVIKTTPMNFAGTGEADFDTITTHPIAKLVDHKFSKDTARGIMDEISGYIDSLDSQVTIVEEAVKFASVQVVPGAPKTHGVMYLDRSLDDHWTIAGNMRTYDYTEASYAFWFKVDDPNNWMDAGGIIAAMGDNNSTCIALLKDSLWLGTGFKDGPNNIMQKAGMPFTSTAWTHVALVIKDGITDLYVNGTKELTLDDTQNYFWNRFSLRANDYWSKCNLGGVYNWNRGAKVIIDAMTGDPRIQFPFQGYMDEFNLYSYAIDQAEIDALIAAGHDGPAFADPADVTAVGIGPNSVAFQAVSANADTFKFEMKKGTDDFAPAAPKMGSKLRYQFFLFDGLDMNTQYIFRTTAENEYGMAEPVLDTVMTRPSKMKLVEHKFTEATGRGVSDEISGYVDSLDAQVSVEPGYLRFASIQVVPGAPKTSGIMYLDRSLGDQWTVNGNMRTYDYTEASYAFWFQVVDPNDWMQDGGIIAAMGDNLSTCIALKNDSLWLGTGFKDGSFNIMQKSGMPFTSTGITHVTLVFKEGITDLYVDGAKKLSIDDTQNYFFNRFSLRANDYWSKCNLGGVYNWNRGAKVIIDAMTGDPRIQFPFQGNLDEFNLYNYAIDQAEIDALKAAGCDIPTAVNDVRAESGLFAYPNPAADVVYLNGDFTGKLEVFDLTGKKVMNINLNGDSQISVSHLDKGMYIFKFLSGSESSIQRIMLK